MKSQGFEDPVKLVQHSVQPVLQSQPVQQSQPVKETQTVQSQTHNDHENNKTALIIGSIIVGSTVIYFSR